MKEMLDSVPIDARPQPDTFRARTGHTLQPAKSRVYDRINKINDYATSNGMILNYKKTKMMHIKRLHTIIFPRWPSD